MDLPLRSINMSDHTISTQNAVYLENLNDPQRQAVLTTEGPLLVLAGAGTGKTKVLTTRLAHILLTHKALPYQTLTVTFTNKAAGEMRERVGHLLGIEPVGWWLGTFHALAVRILRKHADLIGFSPQFTIIDDDDQLRLIKQILAAENIDEKKWPPRVIRAKINQFKDKFIAPDQVTLHGQGFFLDGRIEEIYRTYQERLKTLNVFDFGDLLFYNLILFKQHPDVLNQYKNQFKYILVDEYQDTNQAQSLWLKAMVNPDMPNICCVGDDDQSIYGWRGAEIGNILRFEQDFPHAQIIRLEQNYRSTGHILGAASSLIAQNQKRLGKTLWTQAQGGEKIKVNHFYNAEQEVRYVSDEIESHRKQGVNLNQIAILYRTGAQTRDYEERFINIGLPYRVIGGQRFYERLEIRDAIAYMRLVIMPTDDLAFERIINLPKRGIGPSTMQLLHHYSRSQNISLCASAVALLETEELKPKVKSTIADFLRNLQRWRQLLTEKSHVEVVQTILDESGYTQMWQMEKNIEAQNRLDNLKELINALSEFDTLEGFLEHISLVMDNAQSQDEQMVTLMTMHGAKGLEFDVVFLPAWEEGIFPSAKSLEEKGIQGLEEERRLAYVGITRAKKKLYILSAGSRRIHGQWHQTVPSRFLNEVSSNFIEREQFKPPQSNFGYGSYGGGGYGSGAGGGYRPYQKISSPPSKKQSPASFFETEINQLTPPAQNVFSINQRVFHQKFGYGRIKRVEDDKLIILFEKSGEKKVMADFVVLA